MNAGENAGDYICVMQRAAFIEEYLPDCFFPSHMSCSVCNFQTYKKSFIITPVLITSGVPGRLLTSIPVAQVEQLLAKLDLRLRILGPDVRHALVVLLRIEDISHS